jgi:imidazolonepropionase-like amidohydrolase
MKKITWTFLFFFLILLPLQAQDDELAPVTGTVAVINVNIVPSPGQMIERGTVLVKDGLITEVGKNVSIPPGARIIKADSMYLYSGFILGMSNVGIKMPEQKGTPEVKDPGNPPNDLAGITPERSVNDYLDPSSKSISDWRELGFTTAQTAPSGGMLPGTASVILLKGSNNQVGDFILKPGTALYSTFDGARKMYPATIIGVMAKYRELYRQAEQAKNLGQVYLNDPTGRERPKYNKTLEAFYPVVNKQAPVAFHAEELLPAQRAMLLNKELGFNLILTELKEGWDLMNDIKNLGSPVLFSLDLPEWKEEKKDSAKVEKEEKISAENQRLESRKEEFKKKYYGQMGQFAAANISFGFSGLEGKTGDVQKNLRLIVENGLSEKAALAALTTTPATMLGLNQITGTVEKGKMANLLISNKPYFEKDSKVRYVMVEGKLFDYELKEAQKADPSSIAMAVGTWTYRTDTPDGPITGTMIIKNDDGVLSGTITNSMTGGESTIEDIILTEDKLSFSFDLVAQGQAMTINSVITLSEDSFEGNFNGAGGVYSVKGTKTPE